MIRWKRIDIYPVCMLVLVLSRCHYRKHLRLRESRPAVAQGHILNWSVLNMLGQHKPWMEYVLCSLNLGQLDA
jgi:hypothetical protein